MNERTSESSSNEPKPIYKVNSQRLNPRFFCAQASKPCNCDPISSISKENSSMNSFEEKIEKQFIKNNSSPDNNPHLFLNKRKSYSICVTKTLKTPDSHPEKTSLDPLLETQPVLQHKVSQPILMKQTARKALF